MHTSVIYEIALDSEKKQFREIKYLTQLSGNHILIYFNNFLDSKFLCVSTIWKTKLKILISSPN